MKVIWHLEGDQVKAYATWKSLLILKEFVRETGTGYIRTRSGHGTEFQHVETSLQAEMGKVSSMLDSPPRQTRDRGSAC